METGTALRLFGKGQRVRMNSRSEGKEWWAILLVTFLLKKSNKINNFNKIKMINSNG